MEVGVNGKDGRAAVPLVVSVVLFPGVVSATVPVRRTAERSVLERRVNLMNAM